MTDNAEVLEAIRRFSTQLKARFCERGVVKAWRQGQYDAGDDDDNSNA
jgi:hypothetical protein